MNWTANNRKPLDIVEALVADLFDLTRLDQKSANEADFVDAEGSKYELKCDFYSIKNKSPALFAEFAQSTDGGKTLTSSGIAKQYRQCDFFLLLRQRGTVCELLKVPSDALAELLEKPWQERRTAAYKNGNSFGRFSYGKILPWVEIAAVATDTWVMPSTFDPLNPEFSPRAIGGAE